MIFGVEDVRLVLRVVVLRVVVLRIVVLRVVVLRVVVPLELLVLRNP